MRGGEGHLTLPSTPPEKQKSPAPDTHRQSTGPGGGGDGEDGGREDDDGGYDEPTGVAPEGVHGLYVEVGRLLGGDRLLEVPHLQGLVLGGRDQHRLRGVEPEGPADL